MAVRIIHIYVHIYICVDESVPGLVDVRLHILHDVSHIAQRIGMP